MSKGNKTISSSAFAGGGVSVDLIPAADNTYDIGSTTAQWKNLYLDATGDLIFGDRGSLTTPADGVFLLLNNAGTSVTGIKLGGTTSSFPFIKRSATYSQFRLADDSAYGPIAASQVDIMSGTNRKGVLGTAFSYSSDVVHRWFDNTNIDGGGAAIDLRFSRSAAKTLLIDAGAATTGADLAVGGQASLNGQLATIKAKVTGSGAMSSGATITLTGAIPAGCHLIGVTARVTTTITGPTSWMLGVGGDTDMFGTGLALTSGTTVDINAYTAQPPTFYAADTDILITRGSASDFTAGVVSVTVHYIDLTPATS